MRDAGIGGVQSWERPGGLRGQRVLVLDGTAVGDESVVQVAQATESYFGEAGAEVRLLALRELDIKPCSGCFGCWIKTPGRCVVHDDAEQVAQEAIAADVLVPVGRITFGGYPSLIKRAFDRIICLVSPFCRAVDGETHYRRRYEKYPSLVAVGVQHTYDFDEAAIFRMLVARNAISLYSPASRAVVLLAGETDEDVRSALADGMFGLREKAVK